MSEYDRAYYLLNKAYIIARCREYNKTKGGRVSAAKSSKKQRILYPEKAQARHFISNGIRAGRVTKAPCAVCGSNNAEAHHPDYSKPFDVKWLCSDHHREADSEN